MGTIRPSIATCRVQVDRGNCFKRRTGIRLHRRRILARQYLESFYIEFFGGIGERAYFIFQNSIRTDGGWYTVDRLRNESCGGYFMGWMGRNCICDLCTEFWPAKGRCERGKSDVSAYDDGYLGHDFCF